MMCLAIMTYRTVLAFFSESKMITIHINYFGEQYLDLISLLILWIICCISLGFLIKLLRENTNHEKKHVYNQETIIHYQSPFQNNMYPPYYENTSELPTSYVANTIQEFNDNTGKQG